MGFRDSLPRVLWGFRFRAKMGVTGFIDQGLEFAYAITVQGCLCKGVKALRGRGLGFAYANYG